MSWKFFIAVACVFTGSVALGAIGIARDGVSAYVIVTRDRALPSEQTAARELQDHLKQVTGAQLPIVTESIAGERPQIVIKRSRSLLNDAISIKTDVRDLHLSGAAP